MRCSTSGREARAYILLPHHTRQAFSLTMGWPALQLNAFWNSGMFCTTPSTRYFPYE